MRSNFQVPFEQRLRALEEAAARDETDIKRLWKRNQLAAQWGAGMSFGQLQPTLVLTITNATALEGDPLVFGLSLNYADINPITLELTAGPPGSATPGVDYETTNFEFSLDGSTWSPCTGPNGTRVVIPAGSTLVRVRVDTIADALFESTETLTLSATVITGTLDATDTGTGYIDPAANCSPCHNMSSQAANQYRVTVAGIAHGTGCVTGSCSGIDGTYTLDPQSGDITNCTWNSPSIPSMCGIAFNLSATISAGFTSNPLTPGTAILRVTISVQQLGVPELMQSVTYEAVVTTCTGVFSPVHVTAYDVPGGRYCSYPETVTIESV